MKPSVLVAGTGRMGRSIGLHLLRCGHSVRWLARSRERCEEFSLRLTRDVRRLAKAVPGVDEPGRAEVGMYEDPAPPCPVALIEAVAESPEAKKDALGKALRLLPEDALILSSTSSILPADLHPRAVVVHFFPPPEVAGFVEVVWPPECSPSLRGDVLRFIRHLGLETLEEEAENAFAATRLILPYQNECFRAVAGGLAVSEVNEASRSRLFPAGQFTFLERAGPEVVRSAVANYRSRMGPAEADEYRPLGAGLEALVRGDALGGERKASSGGLDDLRFTLLCALLNACYRLADQGQLDRRGLGLVLDGFFWAEASPEELLRTEGAHRVGERLRRTYQETGLSYFVPAASLGG